MPAWVIPKETNKHLKGGNHNNSASKHRLSGPAARLSNRYITPSFYNDYSLEKLSENVRNDTKESESVSDIDIAIKSNEISKDMLKKVQSSKGLYSK